MKRTCSIFVYQCVVWLLFMLFVNPSSGLVRILDTKSFFILPLIFMVSAVFFIVSVLVYYRISIKAFSVELSAVKNVLAQIGLTVLFDGIIACAVIVFLVSTKSRSSGFMDFQSFSLTGGSLEGKGYTRQRQWDLKPPGKKLTTYYLNEENSHRTVGIQLEMEDQSVYSASDLGKREDYEGGCFLDIDRN